MLVEVYLTLKTALLLDHFQLRPAREIFGVCKMNTNTRNRRDLQVIDMALFSLFCMIPFILCLLHLVVVVDVDAEG